MNKSFQINIVTCGATEKWAEPAVLHWKKRIESLAKINFDFIKHKQPQKLKNTLLTRLGKYPIALTRKGEIFDTPDWVKLLEKLHISVGCVTFLIGEAHGLPEKILQSCREKISLSPTTIQHDVALIVLLEQLYRALSIRAGLPYHKAR